MIGVLSTVILSAQLLALLGPPNLAPPKNGHTYVIAHRGAHVGTPENTLAAYRKAIELGADVVEIDIRTTKDGRFVSVHNRTVGVYVQNGTDRAVRDMTLAELKTLDIGSRVDPKWKDERIPTIEEILTLCKGKITIWLDQKDAAIEPLVSLVKEHRMEDQVLWLSGDGNFAKLKELCPSCMPMPDPADLDASIATTGAKVFAPVWKTFSKDYVDTCHAVGALVFVDVFDEENWGTALDMGADGIQCDDPEALIAFLKKRTPEK
jgi:glycerophosphoryl diester phosphodiesterase